MPQENAPILPHLRTRLKPTVDTVDTVDKKTARNPCGPPKTAIKNLRNRNQQT